MPIIRPYRGDGPIGVRGVRDGRALPAGGRQATRSCIW